MAGLPTLLWWHSFLAHPLCITRQLHLPAPPLDTLFLLLLLLLLLLQEGFPNLLLPIYIKNIHKCKQ